MSKNLFFFHFLVSKSFKVFQMEDLPVPNQHPLPDDLPKNIRADTSQHGKWAVGIVEAIQQNF